MDLKKLIILEYLQQYLAVSGKLLYKGGSFNIPKFKIKMLPDLYSHNLTTKEFFDQLCSEFAELEDQFEEDDGEHYKMERFADYTITQIKLANLEKLKSCFSFLERRLKALNPELENALNVSYCEALLLGKVGNEMEKIIPHMGFLLAKFYREYEAYYINLTRSK